MLTGKHQQFTKPQMATYPELAGRVKEGGYVMLKNRPCEVMEIYRCKTGKHGKGKVRFIGIDLITKKKIEGIASSQASVEVPEVTKKEYQLINISGDSCVLLSKSGATTLEVDLPKGNLAADLQKIFNHAEACLVTVLEVLSYMIIVHVKEATL
jgi:translation initiation factor 5A